MKARRHLGFFIILAVLVAAGGAAYIAQRTETAALRSKRAAAQMELHELRQLRAENERLRAQQIPSAELQRLRDDHAALVRLRAELDVLRKRLPAP